MTTGEEVTFDASRRLGDYEPLFDPMRKEFGPRFSKSIKNWCGIGKRPYPLALWRVYAIRVKGMLAGVAGLYRRVEDPTPVLWLGWFGLLPEYRGRGYAAQALEKLKAIAIEIGARELRVYVNRSNSVARHVYSRAGFTLIDEGAESQSGRSADPHGAVYSMNLGPA